MIIPRIIILIVVSISMLFSAKLYNVVVNNDLDLIEDFTFQDFFDLQDKGAGAGPYGKLISGGVYSDNFDFVKYLEIIEFKRRSGDAVFYSDINEEIDIKVTADNFKEFRENFITRKCLKFDETEFPIKVFKIKSLDNTSEIKFLDGPDNKSGENIHSFNDLIYYVFAKKEIINHDGEEEIYYLVGKQEKVSSKNAKQRMLGWVLAYKEGNVQQVVLWNTNLGIRPNSELNTDLKPLVFEETGSGAISHGEYVQNQTIIEDDIMLNEKGLATFHEKYADRGQVRRWLPNYIFEDNEYGIKVGLKLDYNNVAQDVNQVGGSDRYNIIFIVDASMSMDFTWNSLRPVLDMTIKNLEKETVLNSLGQPMKPRFKVWAYHKNTLQVTSDWVDSDSNFDYASEIEIVCCTPSEGVRPVLSQSVKAALADAASETAYVIVLGDAGDKDYRGEILADVEEIINSYNINYPKFLKGISIYSSSIDAAKKAQLSSEFIVAYNEFEQHFGPDLLLEVMGGSQTIMSTDAQINLAKEISDEIKEDLDVVYGQITNVMQNIKINDQATKQLSGLSRRYIDYLRANAKEFQSGSGTFYLEGIIVSNTPDGENLLVTDILVDVEDLSELNDFIAEYAESEDVDDAKDLIIQLLAIFFQVDRGDIDQSFLAETTIKDFWRRVVGNEDIADKLLPGLFDVSDYTFEELIDGLPTYEEKFLANCQNIANNLNEQLDQKFSMMVSSTNILAGTQSKFYWVKSDDLQLFKGITLD